MPASTISASAPALVSLVDGVTQMAGLEGAHQDVGEVAGDHLLTMGIERHQMHPAAIEELAIAVAQPAVPVAQGVEARPDWAPGARWARLRR